MLIQPGRESRWRSGRSDAANLCERGRDGEWWSKGDRLKGVSGGGVLPVKSWPASLHPVSFSQDLTGRITLPPPPSLWCTPALRHASLSKVAVQSDVFLLLPWLDFMPFCLFSLFSLSPSCFFLSLFSLPAILTKSKHRNWNFSGPANNCMHLDFSFTCVHSLP